MVKKNCGHYGVVNWGLQWHKMALQNQEGDKYGSEDNQWWLMMG